MKPEPRWISKRVALAIHESLLAEHGGAPVLRDDGLLDAALAGPPNVNAYESRADVSRLASAYANAIARNHPFVDGNKRVALTLAGVFLEMNGVLLEASEQDAASAARALASGGMSEREFSRWLRSSSAPAVPPRRKTATRTTTKGRKKK